MSTAKQVTAVKMGVYAYNGSYRAFEGYPISFDTWNINAENKPEWVEGSPVTVALSGYKRANRLSYRPTLSIDLDNSYGTSATNLRTLLNKLSGKYVQDFYAVTTSGTSGGSPSTTLVITSALPATGASDDYFNGMRISGLGGGGDVIISNYDGATRTATLASARTWTNGNALTVKVTPTLPIVLGVSLDDTTGNIIYYNIMGGAYGIERQMTIGKQRVSMNLEGVMDAQTIDDSFRLG
jgi:hypothetical protein